MLLLHIAVVAATLSGASQPTHEPIDKKRKAMELEIHFVNAAKETHYENSLFNREQLQEIEDDFNRSKFSATVAPAETGLAQERRILFEFLQRNPFGLLEPLLEEIHFRVAGSKMTLARLERIRDNTMSAALVPTWFHEAMMSLEPFRNSWNPDMLPQLLAQAPPGGPPLAKSEKLAQVIATIWFEYCVKPTRSDHSRERRFCDQIGSPKYYSLTRTQFNRYLDHLKKHVSRSL